MYEKGSGLFITAFTSFCLPPEDFESTLAKQRQFIAQRAFVFFLPFGC